MDIRTAMPNDQGAIADLMYSSGPELYDFVYVTKNRSALDYIRFEFPTDRGFCHSENVTVMVRDGEVIATGCAYDADTYDRLVMGSIRNIKAHYGFLQCIPVLMRASSVGSMMKRPEEGELYLSNFGVLPSLRGQGVGTQLLEHWIDKAKAEGYRQFSLDVATNNPQAEKLYKRMGLRETEYKRFRGSRRGFTVPDAKKMVLDICS